MVAAHPAPSAATRESVGQRRWPPRLSRWEAEWAGVHRPEPRTSPFRAVGGLRWLVGYAAFGARREHLYATTGFGFPCPFRALTGWECPFCGGTRLGSALLHGDVAAAFAYNPLVFLSLVLGVLVGGLWMVEALGGPKVRPPARWQAAVRRISPTLWWIIGGVAAAVYVVLRNLL